MILLCTSKRHAVKLINFLNHYCSEIEYLVSTSQYGPREMEYDLGICYGFQWLIDEERLSCHDFFNYHPAPLSNNGVSYGDWGNYARGIHDLQTGTLKEWGVSLHCIDKGIDTGTVLRVLKVPLLSIPTDVSELADISHYFLFNLFKQTIKALVSKPKTKEELDRLC